MQKLNIPKYILTILLLSFIAACNNSPTNNSGSKTILPDSNGSIDEILIVADPTHLADSTKKILFNTFSGAFEVLPQYEPTLISRFISYNKMTDLLTRFKTMVVITDLDKEGKNRDFTLQNVPEKVLNDPDKSFYIKKNAWAEPQLIIFLFAKGKANLWQVIVDNGPYITELIQRYYEPFLKEILFTKDHNYKLEKKLKEKYNLKMEIPKEYILAQEEDDFLWIRRETGVSSENIMLYFQPYAFDRDIYNYGVQWRNMLGKKYVSTDLDSSYMTTDTILLVLPSIKALNGKEYIENRGLWKVQNDFMGGPFLNYLIPDEKNKRLIMMDAFIHAPGEDKRVFMRKAEVIFNTLKLEN